MNNILRRPLGSSTWIAWLTASVMFALASCTEMNGGGITPPPTLPANVELSQRAIEANETAQAEYIKMLDAQRAATKAAADAQRIGAQATAAALATREAIAGVATRQALNEQATRQAQIVGATATAQSIQATRALEDVHATATTQSAYATRTVEAAQFTATAHAQNIAATATAQNIITQATLTSASATATANAANAQATRVSADATATVTVAQVLTAQEKAEWDRRLEAGRAIASFIFGALVLVGIAVIIGFAAIRFIDAGVLRARVVRDKTGTVLVIGERDREGRQAVLIPGRAPGAVLSLTPPAVQPLQIETGAVDEDTTKRDQGISLMIAANTGKVSGADELLSELSEGDQVRIVDEPPQQLISGDVRQLIDTNWKELGDGNQ